MWITIGAWLWARKWTVLLIAAIVVAALVAIVVLAVRLAQSQADRSRLLDQLTSAEVVQQLAETQYAVQTAEAADLRALLEARNEQLEAQLASGARVVTLVQTRIVRVPGSADVPGTVTTIPATDGTPAATRVDFRADRGAVHVSGYTLAPPGTAHLEWTIDPIRLDVVVSRGTDGRYRTLIDTHDPDLRIEAASTAIDPSAIDVQRRWYAAATVGVGVPDWKSLMVGVDAGYLFDRWSLGLAYLHDGYGLTAGHHLGLRVGGRF